MLIQGINAGAASPLMPVPLSPRGAAQALANPYVMAMVLSIIQVSVCESTAITRTREPLNDTNWNVWKGSMKHMFKLCKVTGYIFGNIARPNRVHDPEGADNWDFNDSYVAMLIYENISAAQKVHAGQV